MADYGKFSQSAPFRRLLDEFSIEVDEDHSAALVHLDCYEVIQYIVGDVSDTMAALVDAVINHNCTEAPE